MNKKLLKITERGWAGHFCLAYNCQLRRNTLIQYGNIRVVVSTLGLCRDKQEGKFITIGIDRYYETMVFKAILIGNIYWDADVTKQIDIKGKWRIGHYEFNADKEANDMHKRIVEEIKERIKKGEFNNEI